MAKRKKMPDLKDYDKANLRNIIRHQKSVDKLYKKYIDELTSLGLRAEDYNPDEEIFDFDKYPGMKANVFTTMRSIREDLEVQIKNSIEDAKDISGQKNRAVLSYLADGTNLKVEDLEKVAARNIEGMLAFQVRRDAGMDLSSRVWNCLETDKKNIEMAISLGLSEQKSAAEMSRDVRQYLKEDANGLFRRVRDKYGNLKLSKHAQSVHPGQGVYRSGYKNAMRLTRTETNLAYHNADHENWMGNPMVMGIEVVLSNNEEKHVTDICDMLKGKYPKEFDFVGWHPQCMCVALPILCSEEQMMDYTERMANGEDVSRYKFDGQITEMPENFNQWVEENKVRLDDLHRRGKDPYFIANNFRDADYNKGVSWKLTDDEKKALKRKDRDPDEIMKRRRESLEEWDKMKADAEAAMQAAEAYPKDISLTRMREMMDKRQIALREETNAVMAKVKDVESRSKALVDLFPDVDKYHKDNTIDTLEFWHTNAVNANNALATLDLDNQKQLLEDMITAWDGVTLLQNIFKPKLKEVMLEIRLRDIQPKMVALAQLTGGTSLASFKDFVKEAEQLFKARDIDGVENAIAKAEKIQPFLQRYEDIMAYAKAHPHKPGKPLTKIEQALADADDLFRQGKIKDAEDKIAIAEKTRAINEASNAQKAAKRKAEAEAKKNATAQQAAPEPPKKKLGEHENIDDLRQILGNETPVILQNYERSVKREQFVSSTYLQYKDEIEKKLKDMFENASFSTCTDIDLLDDRLLKGGILTNLQRDKLLGYSYGGYAKQRRHYGHFAYDLAGHNGTGRGINVPKKDWLKDEEYYRCGVPVTKGNLYNAYWEDNSGYGGGKGYNAQIIFRKDRVVTTFTAGNSLCTNTIPSLTTDPKICSVDDAYFKNWAKAKYKIAEARQGLTYFEIQYLPLNNNGKIMPRDMESITLPKHPETYHPKANWEKWANEGVSIYYVPEKSGQAILYMKGKPLLSEAEAMQYLENKKSIIEDWLNNEAVHGNMDISFATLRKNIKDKDYISAWQEYEKLESEIATMKKREDAVRKYVPDVEKWHKQFTMDEIEGAYNAIETKVDFMLNKYQYRSDIDRTIAKWGKEMEYAEHPELVRAGAQRHKTWEIAYNYYRKQRDELLYKHRQADIDANLKTLRAFKTKDKSFVSTMGKIEDLVAEQRWGEVEELIKGAKEDMIKLQVLNGEKVMKLGECSSLKFSSKDFTKERKDAALWFKSEAGEEAIEAFRRADAYMTKYAEEMWKNLTEEEKMVLWLYTDGSQYINQEMLGTYCLKVVSVKDGSIRNGLHDANIITSIIEKAPTLKDDVWMQSGKPREVIEKIFGINLNRYNPGSVVGAEGVNELFMSCHSAANGAFVSGANTGVRNDVVLNIFMPKGTKGIYCEPFASYGDDLRGKKGLNWKGKRVKDDPSNQVEFLLQRGAKMKITKAEFDPLTGKWNIDVELIEQTARGALDENIFGFEYRRERKYVDPKKRLGLK